MPSQRRRRLAWTALLLLTAGCHLGAAGPFETLDGRRIRHRETGIVLVRLEPGSFLMGSPDTELERDRDEVLHRAVLPKAFYLGESEVSVAQWRRVMGADAPELEGAPDHHPVGRVTWYRAREFARRLAARSPGWRLPSEVEWEYACRAGTSTPFSFGDNIATDQVNYDGRRPYAGAPRGLRRDGPVAVRSLPSNPWGLYEMHGNLWEWVEDRYVYDRSAGLPPATLAGGPRVIRGGGYTRGADGARCAYRDGYPPRSSGPKYGLRIARSVTR